MLLYPSEGEFIELSKEYKTVPVYCEVTADLETPVSLWSKVTHMGIGFLLESVEQGDRFGRYSFLGVSPQTVIKSRGTEVIVEQREQATVSRQDHPLEVVKQLLAEMQPAPVLDLPFTGGAVGYASYELAYLDSSRPLDQDDGLDLFDCVYMIPDLVYVFDHLYHTIKVVLNVRVDGDSKEQYQLAAARLSCAVKQITETPCVLRVLPPDSKNYSISATSGMPKNNFLASVERVKEAIRQGSLQQAVLSQRFEVPISVSSFAVYRALRSLNPSSYMFYLDLGDYQLVGSSPEVLVRIEEGTVEIHPIAGTRKRGSTSALDEAYAIELLADEKELAEHRMLVELGMQEITGICVPGTVSVKESMKIVKYSHVMHMVSRITGTLQPDKDQIDLFKRVFPAGTVTGFPKGPAMDMIAELEPHRRGPYAGAVGYFSYHGNMDQCITIRTILCRNGSAYVQAGAGIVAQSIPENEYRETLDKARAMLAAISRAEQSVIGERRVAP
ncbi:MAG: anthranilate synthase component I family protein [Limnochordia bacterium]|jgi:anthranilate synthase component 1